jgi:FAD/FMN-containing dehydrogenase
MRVRDRALTLWTMSASNTLQSGVDGAVFVPGDDSYDAARHGWNLAVDRRPAAVVVAESTADVVRATRLAREHGLRVAPQSTGHGASPLEPLDDALLIKTYRLRGVDIDEATRTARTQAGAWWKDVTVPAAEHGLAALAGSSPNVGVTGYTLGGGIGWLARRYGLAANSLTAVELVTPDGRLVRSDADNEPDLLWAAKGGGGVGVVTALEMTLHPVREAYAGALFFPIERGPEVLHTWAEWTAGVPDELTSVGRLMRFPALPAVPDFLRGRSFVVVEAAYLGDATAGADLIGPLRALRPELDTFATTPAPELQHLHMDPEPPSPVVSDGALLASAPAGAIDALLELAGPGAETPLLVVELRHLGGALAREAPGGGPQATVAGEFVLFAAGIAPTRDAGEAVGAHVQAVKDAVSRWRAGYDYFNFLETPAGAEAVLPPASYARLREIKAAYDPDELIVSAHPVRLR